MQSLRRYWPRLTLRRLFIALTVGCLLLAGAGYYGRTVAIAKWLEREDISFMWWADEGDGNGYGPKDVYLRGDRLQPQHWRALGELRTLGFVYICECSVGAEQLRQLPRDIAVLEFADCEISAAVLWELERFSKLKRLSFQDCRLPGGDWGQVRLSPTVRLLTSYQTSGLPSSYTWLSANRELTDLYFIKSDITDESLATMPASLKIENLSLTSTEVTDQGIAHLRSWTALRNVGLRNTKVTDASMTTFIAAPPESLDIRGTAITPQGVAMLVTMPQLKKLYCDSQMIDEIVALRISERDSELELHVIGESFLLRCLMNEWPSLQPLQLLGPLSAEESAKLGTEAVDHPTRPQVIIHP